MASLFELIACNKSLSTNSIFSLQSPKSYTNTSMDILSASLPISNFISYTFPRNHDLLGNLWYQIEANDLEMPIESIKLIISDTTIEHYSGSALELLAKFDRKAKYTKTVFPLRICTSADTNHFLPLVSLAFHLVKIEIKLKDNVKPISHCIHSENINLDTYERRCLAQQSHKLGFTTKYSFDKVIKVENEPIVLFNSAIKENQFHKFIRDIIIRVDNIKSINVFLSSNRENWHERSHLLCEWYERFNFTPQMANYIIPNHFYNVENPEPNIYYIPFDQIPTATNPSHTLNANKLCVKIVGDFFEPGTYNLSMLFRCWEEYKISYGMINI